MDMYRVCGAAALLAAFLGAACRKPEPPKQEARMTPAEITADYGTGWVIGEDWISLEDDQLVMRPADANALAQKLLDYHVCESIAKRDPEACRAEGVDKIPAAAPIGMISLSQQCLRFHGQFLMPAQLMSGASIEKSCPLFMDDGDSEARSMRSKRACAGAGQTYKTGGFQAVYASLAALGDEPSTWSKCKGFPQNADAYKDVFGCRVGAAVIAALQDKDASKCPAEFKSSCEALLASDDPAKPCARAAAELSSLYLAAPRMAAGGALRTRN